MDKPKDEYDALRMLVDILDPFDKEQRERLMRWTAEKLSINIANLPFVAPPGVPRSVSSQETIEASGPVAVTDLKAFIESKKPKSETQFAAAVAYYYLYEAPTDARKQSINRIILSDANRLVKPWKKGIKNPSQTLVNTFNAGLLDRTEERGEYKLNMVGENLVGVLLPGEVIGTAPSPNKRKASTTKKAKIRPQKRKSKTSKQARRTK